jgi:hypothetical protein
MSVAVKTNLELKLGNEVVERRFERVPDRFYTAGSVVSVRQVFTGGAREARRLGDRGIREKFSRRASDIGRRQYAIE